MSDDETQLDIVPLLASVCDETRIEDIMGTWQPHTVYLQPHTNMCLSWSKTPLRVCITMYGGPACVLRRLFETG